VLSPVFISINDCYSAVRPETLSRIISTIGSSDSIAIILRLSERDVRNAVLTDKEGADFFGCVDFNAGNLNRSTRYVACAVLRFHVATVANIHAVGLCVMMLRHLVSVHHSLYHIPGYLTHIS
jgi:hypothetical protein